MPNVNPINRRIVPAAITLGACVVLEAMCLAVAGEAAASASAPPGYIDASAFGYNTADATAALQAAINTGQDVFVPNMGTPWEITPISMYHSGQKVLFESGTVIEAKQGAFLGAGDSLFHVYADNVTLSGAGATLKMRQNDYTKSPYPAASWRMGIMLRGVSNFTAEGLTIKDTGGDGIYVGSGAGYYSNRPYCENVTIDNVVIDNAYRNGVSVISAKNLSIENSVIMNTGNAEPQAGIDFEPNYSTEIIENFSVRNTIINTNGSAGITFFLSSIATGIVAPATGTIENVTIAGNQSDGIRLWHIVPGVSVKDSLIVNNHGVGFIGVVSYLGPMAGQPPNSITFSDLHGNSGGGTSGWVTPVTEGGNISVAPTFFSTDAGDPYFMYLDPSCSPAITHGAGDGGYMGARPVVPEPGTAVLLLAGGCCALWFAVLRRRRPDGA